MLRETRGALFACDSADAEASFEATAAISLPRACRPVPPRSNAKTAADAPADLPAKAVGFAAAVFAFGRAFPPAPSTVARTGREGCHAAGAVSPSSVGGAGGIARPNASAEAKPTAIEARSAGASAVFALERGGTGRQARGREMAAVASKDASPSAAPEATSAPRVSRSISAKPSRSEVERRGAPCF